MYVMGPVATLMFTGSAGFPAGRRTGGYAETVGGYAEEA